MITAEQLHEKQLESVNAGLDPSRKIVPTKGRAGTGKTTLQRLTYEGLSAQGYKVILLAPYGKSAKRIWQATGIPAETVHRALKFTHPGEPDPKTGKTSGYSVPRMNQENPLDADVIMVDEYQTCPRQLHQDIIDAIPRGRNARLLVYGDANQLPPIEENKLYQAQPTAFDTLLRNFKGIELTRNYRQDAGSGVAYNCERIVTGYYPEKRDDFPLDFTDDPVKRVLALVARGDVDYRSIDNQIITPSNKSWAGTIKLNAAIQVAIWDTLSDGLELPRHAWKAAQQVDKLRVKVGEKIIITQNMYEIETIEALHADATEQKEKPRGVYNGEMGIIREIDEHGGLTIDLGDAVVYIPPIVTRINHNGTPYNTDPRKDISLAYAITTHKMLGSECENAIYVMNKSMSFMLNRMNLYTGASRARKMTTLVTDQNSLSLALHRQRPMERK